MASLARTFVWLLALHALVVAIGMALAVRHGFAAGPICTNDPAALRSSLKLLYNESDIGGGQATRRVVVRIFAAPDGASFTIVSFAADGTACVLATGNDLDITPPPAAHERQG